MKIINALKKKSISSLTKLQKKFTFLTKPKNFNKVLVLVGFLILLFLVHHFLLSKEGFESSAEELEDNVAAQKSVVLFYADWCGHCKKFMPAWDKISTELNDSQTTTKFMKVECGKPAENPSHATIMEKYKIQGYPTILVFENGESTEYKGDRTMEGLQALLN